MKFSWQNLPRPFTVLAPLDGVTDVVFRQVIAEIGRPDVLFTEFTACDGLASKGREKVLHNLLFEENQRPIIAQIWGITPENYYKAAKDIRELGFDGIDINMGCPHRTIIKDGACSALIKNPSLANEVIQATKEGAGDLPVSVKTRIGFNTIVLDDWVGFLLRQELAALTVHLRTVSEQSRVPAHWELMSEVKKLRDTISPQTVLIGNGDITTLSEIQKKYKAYSCDGFMVGRGIFANPWLFNKDVDMLVKTPQERVNLYRHHIELYIKRWGTTKNFATLKKFAKTYISNFPESSNLREQLMSTKTIKELQAILKEYKTS